MGEPRSQGRRRTAPPFHAAQPWAGNCVSDCGTVGPLYPWVWGPRVQMVHCPVLFYGRHLSILGWWYPWGVLEPLPENIKGQLYPPRITCFSEME